MFNDFSTLLLDKYVLEPEEALCKRADILGCIANEGGVDN